MTTPWRVPREWVGETVAVLGAGPSLTREQCEYLRGRCRIIAVNCSAIPTVHSVTGEHIPAMAPFADVLYAGDQKWWGRYGVQGLKFPGLKVTLRNGLKLPEVYSLAPSTRTPFDPRRTHLCTGGNSGYQAISLAVHFGAARIVLCGFDVKAGPNGLKHYHGNHVGSLNKPQKYDYWIRHFGQLARYLTKRVGIDVVNCTPGSALRCFRTSTLEQELPDAESRAA